MEQRKVKENIKAVVFDMDGVLIDSEPVYLERAVRTLQTDYPQVTRKAMHPTVGMRSMEYRPFMATLLRMQEGDPLFQEQLERVNAACSNVDYKKIMRPQVPDILKKLKIMGMKLALASSSSLSNIHQVLEECGITEYFDSIISGESFEKGKPDPEIYFCTFERLDVKPEEVLVVEDSTYGVAAGVSSGALVAALIDERFSFDQSPAHMQIESLAEVPEIAARGGE